jgi:hypothetical protein
MANAIGAYLLGVSREQLSTYVHDKVPELSSDIITGWDNMKGEIAASRPVVAQFGINSTNGTRDGTDIWLRFINRVQSSSPNFDEAPYYFARTPLPRKKALDSSEPMLILDTEKMKWLDPLAVVESRENR